MKNIIFIGATAGHSIEFLELPAKNIFDKSCENYSISNLDALLNLLDKKKESIFFIDCEYKNDQSLYEFARTKRPNYQIYDFKPNDITVEAADLLIADLLDGKNYSSKVAIYGTGNISYKLILRLAEKQTKVYLFGRNDKKISRIVNNLNEQLGRKLVFYGDKNQKVDIFISFVSAKQVIDIEYTNLLTSNSKCIDGGIGNFTSKFIEYCNINNLFITRLDVRKSNDILEGYVKSKLFNKFNNMAGRVYINTEDSLVSGGIIGKYKEIIVDNIAKPQYVIGLADGIGGVISRDNYSDKDLERIQRVDKYIRENQ